MKKSEFIDIIDQASCGHISGNLAELMAENLIYHMSKEGFRLPQKRCKMFYDENGQPLKHDSIEYGFDEE